MRTRFGTIRSGKQGRVSGSRRRSDDPYPIGVPFAGASMWADPVNEPDNQSQPDEPLYEFSGDVTYSEYSGTRKNFTTEITVVARNLGDAIVQVKKAMSGSDRRWRYDFNEKKVVQIS